MLTKRRADANANLIGIYSIILILSSIILIYTTFIINTNDYFIAESFIYTKLKYVDLERKPLTNPVTEQDTHFVYAVGCGGRSSYEYQFIQCLTLDNSFFQHQSYGTLTRLVTGCVDDLAKKEYLKRTVSKDITDTSRFEVVFSDKFEVLPSGKVYVMFNRPNGLLKLFKGELNSRFVNQATDDTFIVLDPDFIFRKEFPITYIESNKLLAGYYHMGSAWKHWLRSFCESVLKNEFNGFQEIPGGMKINDLKSLITVDKCSNLEEITKPVSQTKFEGGAPYVLRRKSWLKLLPGWLSLMPIVHDNYYDSIESDMYAWMFAIFFLDLDFEISSNFMRTCMWPERHKDIMTDEIFIHYCQRYHVLEKQYKVNEAKEFLSASDLEKAQDYQHTFTFSKYWLQARGNQLWITDCKAPLLVEIPTQIFTPTKKLQNHFKVIKEVIQAINEAITRFKLLYCQQEPNLEKKMILHEAHRVNNHKLNSIVEIGS